MVSTLKVLHFFLGGQDLEMVTIRDLLQQRAPGQFSDKSLRWGAKASDYAKEIADALSNHKTPVLIELAEDMALPGSVVIVDHHGERAGADRKTSLEQVFELLGRPQSEWTRHLALVAANDRGHVKAMLEVPDATLDEIREIRRLDRSAQGISEAEEASGRQASTAAVSVADGRFTVVLLPHDRTATVTDVLDRDLGGPGFQNLVIFSPAQTTFFGSGVFIERLKKCFPGGYWGGTLPVRGFWGISTALDENTVMAALISPVKSSEIRVYSYRQILIWPLLLKTKEPARSGTQFEQFIEWLKPAWQTAETLPKKVIDADALGNPTSNEPNYEEMVYFHPFVRDFLYGDGHDGDQDERALRRLRRSDIASLEIELADSGEKPMRFETPRVELYLCKPLVALLVVEVNWPAEGGGVMTLETALKIQSQLRQAYPPYFAGAAPGNCPKRVTFLMKNRDKIESNFGVGRQEFAEFVHAGAEPPLARHWRWLLEPLEPFKSVDPPLFQPGSGYYQQIVDDRIPGMTYLAVDDPRLISQGDFDRLCFCDLAGDASFPFSEHFLAKGRDKLVYDRFWRPTPDHDTAKDQFDTRYLCSGFQFLVIGRKATWFFDNIIPSHFRRHYFRIGLIVHFHRAALLKFKDEIAEAIKLVKKQTPAEEFGNREFRERITYLQMTFLKFRSRCWFTEVSNQLQGGEMFAWWSRLLGNPELFEEVDDASKRLYEGMSEYETKSLSKAAFYGLPITILVGALSVIFAAAGVSKYSPESATLALGLLFLGVPALTHLFLRAIRQPGLIPEKWFHRENDKESNGDRE
jgi:hypothetical protein